MKNSLHHKRLIVHYYINIRKILRGKHSHTEQNNMIKSVLFIAKFCLKKKKDYVMKHPAFKQTVLLICK